VLGIECDRLRKTDKIRAIFRELRKASGPEIPAVDLLRLAHLIVRTYYLEDEAKTEVIAAGRSRLTLENMPVDKAMSDGGWHVYFFELEREDRLARDSVEARQAKKRAIQIYLGASWPHQPVQV
jgi:hypothetical protein